MSFVLEKALQHRLARYGRLIGFRLNSIQTSAELELHLKGEKEPITVWIDEYRIQDEGADTHVVVKRARASREWISLMLEEFLIGKPFAIPEKYAGLVKRLL